MLLSLILPPQEKNKNEKKQLFCNMFAMGTDMLTCDGQIKMQIATMLTALVKERTESFMQVCCVKNIFFF